MLLEQLELIIATALIKQIVVTMMDHAIVSLDTLEMIVKIAIRIMDILYPM